MNAFLLFAASCLAATIWGGRHTKCSDWEGVDKIYYPLGVIGAVLFFASSHADRIKLDHENAIRHLNHYLQRLEDPRSGEDYFRRQAENTCRVTFASIYKRALGQVPNLLKPEQVFLTANASGRNNLSVKSCRTRDCAILAESNHALAASHATLSASCCQHARAWLYLSSIRDDEKTQLRTMCSADGRLRLANTVRSQIDFHYRQLKASAPNQTPTFFGILTKLAILWGWPIALLLALSLKTAKAFAREGG